MPTARMPSLPHPPSSFSFASALLPFLPPINSIAVFYTMMDDRGKEKENKEWMDVASGGQEGGRGHTSPPLCREKKRIADVITAAYYRFDLSAFNGKPF